MSKKSKAELEGELTVARQRIAELQARGIDRDGAALPRQQRRRIEGRIAETVVAVVKADRCLRPQSEAIALGQDGLQLRRDHNDAGAGAAAGEGERTRAEGDVLAAQNRTAGDTGIVRRVEANSITLQDCIAKSERGGEPGRAARIAARYRRPQPLHHALRTIGDADQCPDRTLGGVRIDGLIVAVGAAARYTVVESSEKSA